MGRELDIINKLKSLAQEIARQDNRATSNPFWVDSENNSEIFSFFEKDVDFCERNFVKCNSKARKMNELKNLLIELGEFI